MAKGIQMVSVAEAKQLIQENVPRLSFESLPLETAFGYYTSCDVYSSIDLPPFTQASMDGYAFRYEDVFKYTSFKVSGVMKAGEKQLLSCAEGNAIRIFTGAPMPLYADTLVMQEKVVVHQDSIRLNVEYPISLGLNVRPKGSEIKCGDLAVSKGSRLSPAAIGLLASLGIDKIDVYCKPKVTVIVTGDELIRLGNDLNSGAIYESNSYTVAAFLESIGIDDVTIVHVKDVLEEISAALNESLHASDVVLLTGGVSVGEYDFVPQAAAMCDVQKIFHKVRQKPGKPLFFGRKAKTIVFGLPGNPASVLTCLYQYIYPAIHAMYGISGHLNRIQSAISKSYKKPLGITHFLKGYYENNQVTILDGQESYKLKSYAITNCLIEIQEDREEIHENDLVTIHLL